MYIYLYIYEIHCAIKAIVIILLCYTYIVIYYIMMAS